MKGTKEKVFRVFTAFLAFVLFITAYDLTKAVKNRKIFTTQVY